MKYQKHGGSGNEGSYYWNWIYTHQREKDDDYGKDIWEPIEANPDQSGHFLYRQRDENNFKEHILSKSLVKKIKLLCTHREKDVLKLLQKGYNQVEVAKKLHIAESTVKTLVQRIRYKAQNLVVQKGKYREIVQGRKLV